VRQLLDGCPAEGRRPQEILRCIHVGLLCVQEDPYLRPSMASVVVMLNSRSITLPTPAVPAYALHGRAATAVNPPRGMNMGPIAAAREPSINEASVSELQPR
jgi:hypothetical protein